eukprot:g12205.t1
MLSSPSAGGRRIAGNYARGSPGVVRRTVSKPISIIRSTSVPAQLQDRSQGGDPESGGGPQADVESFPSERGALSTSLKANRLYATSCPANLGAHFGRPPGSKLSSMSVVEEGGVDEEEGEEGLTEPKSKTALSILESLASAGPPAAAPAEGSGVDAESVESADSVGGSPIEDDVFELEGLDGLDGDMEALSISETGKDV